MAEVIRENGSFSSLFSTKVKNVHHVSWRRFRYILLVLESHLLHVNDEAGSNSVNEEVANEVAVEIAYFVQHIHKLHLKKLNSMYSLTINTIATRKTIHWRWRFILFHT